MEKVDSHLHEHVYPLQSYFSCPVEDMDECLDLDGCCSTMVILIVWMCLRFGCRDPQIMVDSLRCAMRNKRHELLGTSPTLESAAELGRYLLRLRAWHNGLVDPQLPDIKHWLKLNVVSGTANCNYMLYDDANGFTLCDFLCEKGGPWCENHALPIGTDIMTAPYMYDHMQYVPHAFNHYRIRAAGYFEDRWKESEWKCSLDTMRSQLEEEITDPEEADIVVLRFYGFMGETIQCDEIEKILRQLNGTIQWPNTTAFAAELLLPPEIPATKSDAKRFTRTIAEKVPLQKWRVAAVYVQQNIFLLSLNMHQYEAAHHLETALLQRYDIKGRATLILQIGNLDHLMWLNTLRAKHEMEGVGFHLVFSVTKRWTRYMRTVVRLLKVFIPLITHANPKPFDTQWYNDGTMQWIGSSCLYLTVTDRPGVKRPDGGVHNVGSSKIYAEDFLLLLLQELFPLDQKRPQEEEIVDAKRQKKT